MPPPPPHASARACKKILLAFLLFTHRCAVHNTALLLIETFTTLCDACVQTLIVQYAREQNTTHALIARLFTSFIFYSMNASIYFKHTYVCMYGSLDAELWNNRFDVKFCVHCAAPRVMQIACCAVHFYTHSQIYLLRMNPQLGILK